MSLDQQLSMLRTTVLTNSDLVHPCLGCWFISAPPVDVLITPWVKFWLLAAAPLIFSCLEQILKLKPGPHLPLVEKRAF